MRASKREHAVLHDILVPTRSLVRATECPPLITLTTLARIVIKISFWSEATRNSCGSGIAAFFNPADRRARCRSSCRRKLIKLSFSCKHGRRFKRLLVDLTFHITEFLVLSSLEFLGFFGKFYRVADVTIVKYRFSRPLRLALLGISIILDKFRSLWIVVMCL